MDEGTAPSIKMDIDAHRLAASRSALNKEYESRVPNKEAGKHYAHTRYRSFLTYTVRRAHCTSSHTWNAHSGFDIPPRMAYMAARHDRALDTNGRKQ